MGRVSTPQVRSTGAKGKLPSLQKIAIASGLLEGHSNGEIARTTGLSEQTVHNVVQNDPYLGGLLDRLVSKHEDKIETGFELLLVTSIRDMRSEDPGIVSGGRRDFTKVMSIVAQVGRDNPESNQRPVVVINLPATLPASLPQVVKSSNR